MPSNEHMTLRQLDPPLAVEVLVYEVRADAYDRWIAADHEYWTEAESARFPGYAGKETWLCPGDEFHKVTLVIYWESLEAWQSVDQTWVAEQEHRFRATVGADSYRLLHASHTADQFFKVSEYR